MAGNAQQLQSLLFEISTPSPDRNPTEFRDHARTVALLSIAIEMQKITARLKEIAEQGDQRP
jgi:hypothetical protein